MCGNKFTVWLIFHYLLVLCWSGRSLYNTLWILLLFITNDLFIVYAKWWSWHYCNILAYGSIPWLRLCLPHQNLSLRFGELLHPRCLLDIQSGTFCQKRTMLDYVMRRVSILLFYIMSCFEERWIGFSCCVIHQLRFDIIIDTHL